MYFDVFCLCYHVSWSIHIIKVWSEKMTFCSHVQQQQISRSLNGIMSYLRKENYYVFVITMPNKRSSLQVELKAQIMLTFGTLKFKHNVSLYFSDIVIILGTLAYWIKFILCTSGLVITSTTEETTSSVAITTTESTTQVTTTTDVTTTVAPTTTSIEPTTTLATTTPSMSIKSKLQCSNYYMISSCETECCICFYWFCTELFLSSVVYSLWIKAQTWFVHLFTIQYKHLTRPHHHHHPLSLLSVYIVFTPSCLSLLQLHHWTSIIIIITVNYIILYGVLVSPSAIWLVSAMYVVSMLYSCSISTHLARWLLCFISECYQTRHLWSVYTLIFLQYM